MPGFRVGDLGDGSDTSKGQPQAILTYTWTISNILGTATDGNALIYLRDATLPTFTVSKEQVQGSSLEYKFAKSVNWDDIKVTWYDTVGLLGKIKQWRLSVWDDGLGIMPASQYKKYTFLETLLPTGDSVNNWTLHNSWPSTIKYGDLTYTQSDVKLMDVTVTYDWATESGP